MLIPRDPLICPQLRDPDGARHQLEDENCRIPLPSRRKPSCWPSMIENMWFPKAFGLWRVQGGALALLWMP
jgi:hypothetical protein